MTPTYSYSTTLHALRLHITMFMVMTAYPVYTRSGKILESWEEPLQMAFSSRSTVLHVVQAKLTMFPVFKDTNDIEAYYFLSYLSIFVCPHCFVMPKSLRLWLFYSTVQLRHRSFLSRIQLTSRCNEQPQSPHYALRSGYSS